MGLGPDPWFAVARGRVGDPTYAPLCRGLLTATAAERETYELIGDGEGIHWPALDEDVSVEGLLAGRRSVESAASLARWMAKRKGRAGKEE